MKNTYEIVGDLTYIDCTFEGKTVKAVIDTSSLEIADSFPNKWYVKRSGSQHVYVAGVIRSHKKQRVIYLHRLITDCPEDKVVDHINHNTLDNRLVNLRICDHQMNSLNMHNRRGVTFRRDIGKWRARLYYNGVEHFLGHYDTREEALAARILAEKELGIINGDDIKEAI